MKIAHANLEWTWEGWTVTVTGQGGEVEVVSRVAAPVHLVDEQHLASRVLDALAAPRGWEIQGAPDATRISITGPRTGVTPAHRVIAALVAQAERAPSGASTWHAHLAAEEAERAETDIRTRLTWVTVTGQGGPA